MWFAGEHIRAPHTVLACRVFLLRTIETIEVSRYAHLLKPKIAQERNELCLRQSAGDSTRPQVNVASNVLTEFDIQHYIAKLQSSARTEHTADLCERFLFFRDQVENAI